MEAVVGGLATIRRQLGDTAAWGERGERLVTSGLVYGDGEPAVVRVRKRGGRYEIDDRGDAVRKARALGAGADWLGLAELIVADEGFNVNRRGVVFVQAVEGRDVARLAHRLGECAFVVHSALLESTSS